MYNWSTTADLFETGADVCPYNVRRKQRRYGLLCGVPEAKAEIGIGSEFFHPVRGLFEIGFRP